MNLIGKWKIAKTMFATEDGINHLTKEEIIEAGGDGEDLQLFESVIDFTADGKINTLLKVPEDQIADAKAAGLEIDKSGLAIIDSAEWTEEDGKFFAVIGGESAPLEKTPDGYLLYGMGMMLLEKLV